MGITQEVCIAKVVQKAAILLETFHISPPLDIMAAHQVKNTV
jgi:hypothetical protein